MSKKNTNKKSDLKKVIGRNQHKKIEVEERNDMQSQENEETTEELKASDKLTASDSCKEKTGDAQPSIAEKQDNHPLTPEQKNKAIAIIKEHWSKIESKQDLLVLLNLALMILYGENANRLTLRTLNHYAYSSHNNKRYITFQVPKKKKGEFRTIDAPCAGLKMIQRALNLIFQLLYTPNQYAMGFVPHRSVVSNAKIHVGQKYVYNLDLKDFFPSITSGRLFKRLQIAPFKMKKGMASIVTDLCCYTNAEGENVLPQGAPTSPTITNFICENLDRKLSKLGGIYGMNYSRYADDITFSSMSNKFSEEGSFCKSLHHIIEEEEHLKINPDKTRLCYHDKRQEVTGLTVNEKPNVTRKYIKQIRLYLHIWEAKGLPEAQRLFEKNYTPKTTRPNAGIPHIENVIAGKILYLKMVIGESNEKYKKLNTRLEKLLGINKGVDVSTTTLTYTDNKKHVVPVGDVPLTEKEILEEFLALDKLLE